MSKNSLALGIIPFGVVVLAEPHISDEEMYRDLKNIRKLHFNTIVLYPSVCRWEGKRPGETAFGFIDKIMDWCQELELKVILELQGQVMQDADAPECSGYVQHENYRENGFHQKQKEKLLRTYFQEVVTHFKGHPSLLAYDIFNEIGNESRSPETILAFVNFLNEQYHGDIQKLNNAWATYFKDFKDILRIPPNYKIWSWSSVVAERDWLRFRSLDFAKQIEWWRNEIQKYDSKTPLFVDVLGSDVLHNRTDAYFGVSDWDVIEQTDVLGLSCYANMLCENWWEKDAWLWPQFWRHAKSVAQDKQVIISELMTQNRSLFPLEKSSMNDEILLWSYQAVFHGMQGLIYWKYRPFYRGRQASGRGLTNFDGEPNSFAYQASEVAQFVEKNAHDLVVSRPDDSGITIIHDPEAERIYRAIGVEPSTFYTDSHRGWFKGFWSIGMTPSYTTPKEFLKKKPSSFKIVVVPTLACASREFIEALIKFVQQGGILITEGRFAVLDENGNLYPHVPGNGFHNISGIEEIDFSSRFSEEISWDDGKLVFNGDYFQKTQLEEKKASALFHTAKENIAVSKSTIGKGTYFHIPFFLGHKIERNESSDQALSFFKVMIEKMELSSLSPIKIQEKGLLTDVSILLKPDGNPYLIGICNYSHEPESLLLKTRNFRISPKTQDDEIEIDSNGIIKVHLLPRSHKVIFIESE